MRVASAGFALRVATAAAAVEIPTAPEIQAAGALQVQFRVPGSDVHASSARK